MWIFSVLGFFSVVCARNPVTGKIDPETVMIRARVKKHLRNLQNRFPSLAGVEILAWPERDYGFRLIVPKAVWVDALDALAQEKTWGNFKNEAAKHEAQTGSAYVNALHDVWSVMFQLQSMQEHHTRR
jgi:hypothetical protein